MCCFNKSKRPPIISRSGRVMDSVVVPFSKNVEDEGITKTVVRFEEISHRNYMESADIPESDNYLLSEMIKQGYVPNEVPVNHLLESFDELDGVNQKLLDDFKVYRENNPLPISDSVSDNIIKFND